jgi:hypothetical protein
LITHPLQLPLLVEYGDDLATIMSELVPSGQWAPGRAYLCLVQKRSRGYRELVFPALIDSVVGRCIIDALEPAITRDDGERAFCGRSHASSQREFGDYEHWFHLWRDYSAQLAAAASQSGFMYVFDTDVADFFPSIDRERAREFLASRTGAHPSVLSLLFSCLHGWLPRINYSPMTGLPIENNDVSRLVAHNYLKQVDGLFVARRDCVYLRYVDDTVIFAASEEAANEFRRSHHLALREIGLNPNAAKSEILTVANFEAKRHREFNAAIEEAFRHKDTTTFESLAAEWLLQTSVDGWDQVTKRLYTVAQQLRSHSLRSVVSSHVQDRPALAQRALEYLAHFDVTQTELDNLLEIAKRGKVPADVDIRLARFFGDAIFEGSVSDAIANMAILRIQRDEVNFGSGYCKGLWLLTLHKFGKRRHRQPVLEWASVPKLVDEQFRLHFTYVFKSLAELPAELEHPLRHLGSSDIELTIRCCLDAAQGRLMHRQKILARMTRSVNGRRTIAARYLPLLRLIMKADPWRTQNLDWLHYRLQPKRRPECHVILAFLERLAGDLAA